MISEVILPGFNIIYLCLQYGYRDLLKIYYLHDFFAPQFSLRKGKKLFGREKKLFGRENNFKSLQKCPKTLIMILIYGLKCMHHVNIQEYRRLCKNVGLLKKLFGREKNSSEGKIISNLYKSVQKHYACL